MDVSLNVLNSRKFLRLPPLPHDDVKYQITHRMIWYWQLDPPLY